MISLFRRARPATFVLSSQLIGVLDAGGGKKLPNYVFRELPEGALGPSNPAELSRYDLHDREAFLACLQECLIEAKLNAKQAHLALDGALIRQLNLPLPFMPAPDELRLAVQTEAERYVMFAGGDVGLDFGLLRHEPETIALLFAACRSDFLLGIIECFAACGIEVASIEPFSFALMRGLSLEYPEVFAATEDVNAIISVLPHKLEVSYWQNQQVLHWRHIYLDTHALLSGELSALSEAQLELQRTLRDHPAQQWFLLDVPEALDSFLIQRFNLNVSQRVNHPEDTWQLVARGADAYGPDGFPFALNLQLRREEKKRRLTNEQLLQLGAAIGILLVSFIINAILGLQAQSLQNTISQVQRETEAMQSVVRQSGSSSQGHELALDVLARAEGISDLFSGLRDVTPSDLWIRDTQLETEKQLSIRGLSISRSAPLAFAQALSQFPRLTNVTVSDLTLEDREGCLFYHFKITADMIKGSIR